MRNLILATLVAGVALAAPRQEPVTYVEGNLTGIAPNSGGSLVLAGDQAMELKAGSTTVSVPYKSISKAELGTARAHSPNAPLYKVWTLHKRILKTQTQTLQVAFRDESGETKNMTVELAKPVAEELMATIQQNSAAGQSARAPSKNPQWWGDDYWKTTRNGETWPKSNSPE